MKIAIPKRYVDTVTKDLADYGIVLTPLASDAMNTRQAGASPLSEFCDAFELADENEHWAEYLPCYCLD